MKLFYLARAGQLNDRDDLDELNQLSFEAIPVDEVDALDEMILRDGLKAMCLETRLEAGCYRVRTRVPDIAIQVDLKQCRFERTRLEYDIGQVNPAYLFPPSLAARMRGEGVCRGTLKINCLEDIDPLVTGFLEGEFPAEVKENIYWE
jgi:hypothetical protein